jgi:hypothetical protein
MAVRQAISLRELSQEARWKWREIAVPTLWQSRSMPEEMQGSIFAIA